MRSLEHESSKLIRRLGLQELGNFYHRFGPRAFSGVVSLVDSHVAIHTWPEDRYVSLDVFVCNDHHRKTAAARRLFRALASYFRPGKVIRKEIRR